MRNLKMARERTLLAVSKTVTPRRLDDSDEDTPQCILDSPCFVEHDFETGMPACSWFQAIVACDTPLCPDDQASQAMAEMMESCICDGDAEACSAMGGDDESSGVPACIEQCMQVEDSPIAIVGMAGPFQGAEASGPICEFFGEGGGAADCMTECTPLEQAMVDGVADCACLEGGGTSCQIGAENGFGVAEMCMMTCLPSVGDPDQDLCDAVATAEGVSGLGIEDLCPGITDCFQEADPGSDNEALLIVVEMGLKPSLICNCNADAEGCEDRDFGDDDDEDDHDDHGDDEDDEHGGDGLPHGGDGLPPTDTYDPTLPSSGACSCDPDHDPSACPSNPWEEGSGDENLEEKCGQLKGVQESSPCCFGSYMMPGYATFYKSFMLFLMEFQKNDPDNGGDMNVLDNPMMMNMMVKTMMQQTKSAIEQQCSIEIDTGEDGCGVDSCGDAWVPGEGQEGGGKGEGGMIPTSSPTGSPTMIPTSEEDAEADEEPAMELFAVVPVTVGFTMPPVDLEDEQVMESVNAVLEETVAATVGVGREMVTVTDIREKAGGAGAGRRRTTSAMELDADVEIRTSIAENAGAGAAAGAIESTLDEKQGDGSMAAHFAEAVGAEMPEVAAQAEEMGIDMGVASIEVEMDEVGVVEVAADDDYGDDEGGLSLFGDGAAPGGGAVKGAVVGIALGLGLWAGM
ncbi:hypothetical protein TeGR_g10493 [Tetraparma gracilis]|uniref:Uncharacterized protein n=1 Tax=Tetraparma gracilis TaxID=2962635 RepID=A0ABQ6M530_9STRA|nr:hypothetical protein TeGR_g10493 [Tetraparma gracilis]